MAPTKFGLFKSRSREQPDQQPSVEHLIQSSSSIETVLPESPISFKSNGTPEDMPHADLTALSLNDLSIEKPRKPMRRSSDASAKPESIQIGYHPLTNQLSAELTSTSTLQDYEDYDRIQEYEELTDADELQAIQLKDSDGASTSCDASSLQLDTVSIAPSEDLSVYCNALKKHKKHRSKDDEQDMKDCYMWQASNIEVMQNLLAKSGTPDDQIKWQAIATTRGLCTLTDCCTCPDCHRSKFLAGVADGDGGLGTAPLINAVSVGCSVQ